MAGDSGSKTEKATPKKRKDQRKEGNVFQSNDVVNVVTLFGTFYVLKQLLPGLYQTVRDFMVKYLSFSGTMTDTSAGKVNELTLEFAITVAKTMLPFFLICMALGVVSAGVQTRFLFASKGFMPKFSRLNPIEGIKKLFSVRNVVELVKGILKVVILVAMTISLLKADMVKAIRTMDMDILNSVVYMLTMVMDLIIRISMAFLAIAFLDYLYQWWEYERNLKMSKQELKEEYKQTEGNPEIKGRIRNLQQQRSRARMMQAVPEADVIIRNPTHYAVALKYDIELHNAPIVVAKGQDELALRIIRVGEEHGVAIIENRPLARGLYESAKLEDEIPNEYYGVVAEILVYVYKMNKKME